MKATSNVTAENSTEYLDRIYPRSRSLSAYKPRAVVFSFVPDAALENFKVAVADEFDWLQFDPSAWTVCASFGS